MGADRGWTRIHGLLDSHLRICAQCIAAEVTQYDADDIQHHTAIGTFGLQPLPYVAKAIADITTWGVGSHAVFGSQLLCAPPFCWQTAGQPIHLSCDIVKDMSEPKTLEPPRSS